MTDDLDQEFEYLLLEDPDLKLINDYSLLKEENNKLKNALLGLISWSDGGRCNDCIPFREAPSQISYIHHKDCGYLESLNDALIALGRLPEEGHNRIDAEADMIRMAEERYQDCVKKGLMK